MKATSKTPSLVDEYKRPSSTIQCCIFILLLVCILTTCFLVGIFLWPALKLHVVLLSIGPLGAVPEAQGTTIFLSTSCNISFMVQNPRVSSKTSYNDFDVSLLHQGVLLSSQGLDGFDETGKGIGYKTVQIVVSASFADRVVRDMAIDVKDSVMEFDVHVRGRVSLNSGSLLQRSKYVHFLCDDLKVRFDTRTWTGTMGGIRKACHNTRLLF